MTRKLPLGDGAPIAAVIAGIRQTAERVAAVNRPDFGRTADRLRATADDFDRATDTLAGALAAGRTAEALAGATPYLRLAALGLGGALLAEGALSVHGGQDAARAMARFFAETFVGETANLAETVVSAGTTLGAAASVILSER